MHLQPTQLSATRNGPPQTRPEQKQSAGKVSNELFELRTTRCDEGLFNSGGERIE
jgi:hypothetical protein